MFPGMSFRFFLAVLWVCLGAGSVRARCPTAAAPNVWVRLPPGPAGEPFDAGWLVPGERFFSIRRLDGRWVGAMLDICRGTWEALERFPQVDGVAPPLPVFTGRELLLFGGKPLQAWNHPVRPPYAWRYDLRTGIWRPMSPAGAPQLRGGTRTVWLGSKLFVTEPTATPSGFGMRFADLYDPTSDSWQHVSDEQAPPPGTELGDASGDTLWFYPSLDAPFEAPGPEFSARALRLFDARANRWRSPSPAPPSLAGPFGFSHWNGAELWVWSSTRAAPQGSPPLRWNAGIDRWTTIPAPPLGGSIALQDGKLVVIHGDRRAKHDVMTGYVLDGLRWRRGGSVEGSGFTQNVHVAGDRGFMTWAEPKDDQRNRIYWFDAQLLRWKIDDLPDDGAHATPSAIFTRGHLYAWGEDTSIPRNWSAADHVRTPGASSTAASERPTPLGIRVLGIEPSWRPK